MATIDIDIEDYLDEVSDYYLIRELKRRADNGNAKAKNSFNEDFKEVMDEFNEEGIWPEIKTLDDERRRDWVNENWNNIPI